MYLRNKSSQIYGFNLINKTTGDDVAGATVTVTRTLDSGSQASGTGTVDDMTGGEYRYNFSQADTDCETGHYVFKATGAITRDVTIAFFADYDGIAQGGGASTITLEAGFSTVTNAYVGWRIAIVDEVGNTGRGQARTGIGFNTSTGVLTVDRAWDVQPVSGTKYAWSTPADIPSYVRDDVADSVLGRSVSNVEATMPEHCIGTIILQSLESAVTGPTELTIYRSNGSTTHATKTLTTVSSPQGITSIS